MLKIWEIQSENFKKLNVKLAVEGKSVTVTGDNEVGKTSFIDAIFNTLTGKKTKGTPVKLGKNTAKNKVTLRRENGETIDVEKTFTADGKSTLTVKLNSATKVTSPQKFLDETLGQISFDPLEFVNKTPLEQKRFLMDLLGIDLEEFESRKRTLLDDVDSVSKDLIKVQGELNDMITLDKEYKHIDPSDAVKENEKVQAVKKEYSDLNTELENKIRNSDSLKKDGEDINEQIEKLQGQLKAKRDLYTENQTAIKSLKTKLDRIEIPESDSLEEKLKEIQKNNEYFRLQQERQAKIKEIEQIETMKVDALAKVKAIEKQRNAEISKVKMPIEGLEFMDNGLSYNGLLLTEDNIATSRIIEIGVRISMALNPELKIMQIKDGSLLGKGILKTIRDIVKENDYQLFMEKVTDDKEIGFEISEA